MTAFPKLIIGEQSGTAASVTSRARIAAANDLGVRHLRLNWNTASPTADPTATCCAIGITWSEGRSILAERAFEFKEWDYILLLDDDIFLLPHSNVLASQLRKLRIRLENSRRSPTRRFLLFIERVLVESLARLPFRIQRRLQRSAIKALIGALQEAKAWSGILFSATDWGLNGSHSRLAKQDGTIQIAGGDLQTRIYSRNLAEVVFPAPIPGSEGSMWFVDYLVNTFAPEKQILFRVANAINLKHNPHSDGHLSQFRSLEDLLGDYAGLLVGPWPVWCGLGNQIGAPIRATNANYIINSTQGRATGEVSIDALRRALTRPE